MPFRRHPSSVDCSAPGPISPTTPATTAQIGGFSLQARFLGFGASLIHRDIGLESIFRECIMESFIARVARVARIAGPNHGIGSSKREEAVSRWLVQDGM